MYEPLFLYQSLSIIVVKRKEKTLIVTSMAENVIKSFRLRSQGLKFSNAVNDALTDRMVDYHNH